MSPAELSLLAATITFVGTHFLLSHPLRPALVGRLGEGGFAGFYSLVALLTFAWMILAWRAAGPTFPLWIAPTWWWLASAPITLFASILLFGSFVRNPAFPHPGARPREIPPPRGVFAITRHPMNWAFIMWAIVHLGLWGSHRNLTVAGGILILALFGSIGQDRRKSAVMGDTWGEWRTRTAFVPFGAQFAGRLPWRSALLPGWFAFLAGSAFWLLVTWWHAPNISPIAIYRDFGWLLWE
jgi:uncharacterized membrane protein